MKQLQKIMKQNAIIFVTKIKLALPLQKNKEIIDSNKFRLLLRENILIKDDELILNRTMKLYPLEIFD